MKLALVGFVAGVGVTLLLAVVLAYALLPNCPQEDSCTPDYQSHWYGKLWTGKVER